MTPQEENERISIWAGLECRCEELPPPNYWSDTEIVTNWVGCPRHSNGGLPPDYDRDEVAVGLMEVLVAKGQHPLLFHTCKGWGFIVNCHKQKRERKAGGVWDRPTVAAAIKAAVLRLIEKETP